MNDWVSMLMKDKTVKKILQESEKVTSELLTMARTYLGVWEEKNGEYEQIRQGDRDLLFESLDRIENLLLQLNEKLDALMKNDQT